MRQFSGALFIFFTISLDRSFLFVVRYFQIIVKSCEGKKAFRNVIRELPVGARQTQNVWYKSSRSCLTELQSRSGRVLPLQRVTLLDVSREGVHRQKEWYRGVSYFLRLFYPKM